MLTKMNIKVNDSDLNDAKNSVNLDNFKISFNQPTSTFFYDPWVIKEEFKGTIWEKLLKYLPENIGEARLIVLQPGTCYNSHSDIDDRYHLNIFGNYSFLVDIDSQRMYKTIADGYWYDMDAGPRHSAVNYGDIPRAQLVVRKLLTRNTLNNPVSFFIEPNELPIDDARYLFDDTVSIWLNKGVKEGLVTNFSYNPTTGAVQFDLEQDVVDFALSVIPKSFKVTVNEY